MPVHPEPLGPTLSTWHLLQPWPMSLLPMLPIGTTSPLISEHSVMIFPQQEPHPLSQCTTPSPTFAPPTPYVIALTISSSTPQENL